MFLRNGGNYLSDCTASYLRNVMPLILLVTESTVRCEPDLHTSIHIHDLVFAHRDEVSFAL